MKLIATTAPRECSIVELELLASRFDNAAMVLLTAPTAAMREDAVSFISFNDTTAYGVLSINIVVYL